MGCMGVLLRVRVYASPRSCDDLDTSNDSPVRKLAAPRILWRLPNVGWIMRLEPFLADMRPKIHRYCARMTGSVIDGEDVTQDTLLKAVGALKRLPVVDHPDRWLFRIAHNYALDFLRRRTRTEAILSGEDPETLADVGEM